MQNGGLTWAAWSAGAILIYHRRPGGTVERISLPREMKADLRYFLKLYRLTDGSLLLRSGNGHGTCLDVARGAEGVRPVEGWPESLSAYPPYRVVPLADGTIAGISSDPPRLILWQPGAPSRASNLPEGLMIRDVDKDDQGRLWICGGFPPRSLGSSRYRRTLAMSADGGISWHVHEVTRGGLKVAWRSLFSGAEAAFRTIDVFNDHVVLSAETDDYNITSTFLFAQDAQGRWRSGVLEDDILRAVLPVRHGELEVISHYGRVVSITSRNRWQYRSLLPRIHGLLQSMDDPPPEDARYEVLDAQAAPGGERILVVSVRVSEGNRRVRFGEAVVTLSEQEDSLIAFHNRDMPEITTASSLR